MVVTVNRTTRCTYTGTGTDSNGDSVSITLSCDTGQGGWWITTFGTMSQNDFVGPSPDPSDTGPKTGRYDLSNSSGGCGAVPGGYVQVS